MKKSYILIAVAMVAAFSMTSCKNNKKSQNQEPTQEEIQAQKQALADSVLAKIDAFAEEYVNAKEKSFNIYDCDVFKLSEEEKLVKPDYLLDPSEANKLVTKSQKVNALAIYLCEIAIREMYDMPTDETKDVIAKLVAEINYPIEPMEDVTLSELVKKHYETYKQNDDLATFWQFQNAFITELFYLIAHNPDFIFSRTTEEQREAFISSVFAVSGTIEVLAEYDDEMNELLNFKRKMRISQSPEDYEAKWGSIEAAKQTYSANMDTFIARRNALLQ